MNVAAVREALQKAAMDASLENVAQQGGFAGAEIAIYATRLLSCLAVAHHPSASALGAVGGPVVDDLVKMCSSAMGACSSMYDPCKSLWARELSATCADAACEARRGP